MPDTQAVSNVAERTITVVRTFDGSREQLWKAWTDPAEFSCWAGCDGHSIPESFITIDLRPGGAFNFTMVNDATGEKYPSTATYREIVEPERLVWSFAGPTEEVVVTMTLTDLGDGRTEMYFRQVGFGPEDFEAGLRDSRAGHAEEIDKLAAYLTAARVG
ncbi:MAG TPA: SRPBCC domain-containing protein [Mycobacteriales bacterium]|nr:SRPBCC domain-containing protein [Mycobacteriales bacterium]